MMPVLYDSNGSIMRTTSANISLHNIKEVRLEKSQWVTKSQGVPLTNPYTTSHYRFKGETGDYEVTTYEPNGIIIDDAQNYTVEYATNAETGTKTMTVRRKQHEEPKEKNEMPNPSFDRHLDNQIEERFGPEPEHTEFCEGCDRLTDAENDGQTCTDCGWDYGATPLEMAEKFQAQVEALKEENKKLRKQLAEELDDDGIPLPEPKAHSQNLPCAVCGDAPSLPTSLACGDCVEGGTK